MGSKAASAVVVVLLMSCVYPEPAAFEYAFMSSKVSHKSCNSNSISRVRSLTVSPDPPRVGNLATTTAEIESSELVSGGQVQVQVKGLGNLSFIQPPAVTQDMCSLLPTGCPVNKGITSMTITQKIPSFIPVGWYHVKIKAQDNGGRALLCEDINLQLTSQHRKFIF